MASITGIQTIAHSEPNLVGYWKMEEGTGTTVVDSSGQDHTMTFRGTTTPTWSTGIIGNCTSYNGTTAYMDTPWSTDFDFGTGLFTLTARIKLNAISATAGIFNIRDAVATAGRPTVLWLVRNTNMSLECQLRDNTAGSTTTTFTSDTVLSDATVYHVALVRTSQEDFAFYVDGQPAGTLNIPDFGSLTPISTQQIQIGAHYYGGTPRNTYMKGLIDEAKIFKGKALSATEILAEANLTTNRLSVTF